MRKCKITFFKRDPADNRKSLAVETVVIETTDPSDAVDIAETRMIKNPELSSFVVDTKPDTPKGCMR